MFTHLHVHSHYSILDGMSKVPDLVDKAIKYGMPAIALTDHGNMYGIKEFLDYVKKVNKKPKNKLADAKAALAKETDTARKAIIEKEIEELTAKLDAFVPFKPIVGVEAYCARRSRHDKDKDVKYVDAYGKERILDSSGWHLILLAKNKTGYFNLCRIVSLSYIDGFYNRPRIDKELLEQYHEGIICSSACLGGEIPQIIMQGKREEAEQAVQWFKSIFGDDYYLELQRHETHIANAEKSTYEHQKVVNPILLEIAQKYGIKVIATNDVHFVEEEHAEAHDRLICLATNHYVDDVDRMRYTKQEWLKSPEQMEIIFEDIPEAITNTQEIVDKVEVYDIDSDPIMPKFDIPADFGTEEEYRQRLTEQDLFDEFTRNEKGEVVLSQEEAEKKIKKLGGYDKLYRIKLEADYLAKLTWEGAKRRYGEDISQDIKDRIIFELHIMKTMGFPGYFLIVSDYIKAARDMGISVGPGRGSAAGSVVAYCLKITDLDPLKYDLLFERFLNPDRISLPDIDVDFEDSERGRVLDWVSNKYGATHVAHIITYGTMATKSSIADVGRVQQVPLSTVNNIKKLIPNSFPDNIVDENGKTPKVNLKNVVKYVPEFRDLLNNSDQRIPSMINYATQLEDTIRQVGIHACGVIIGADDLTKFAPLATVKDKASNSDIIVTEYDGHYVESVGLIKMDFLGLSTLSIIKEALRNIKKRHGIDIDIDNIPIDDPLTYKLYQEGRTVATFQFESAGMRKYLKELHPTVFGDLIAMNALYRPGPMDYIPQFIRRKQGTEAITYDLPVMEKYLKETYGVTVYQEQVMLLSRLLANFTRGESDQLRKAMGKKKLDLLAELYPKFIDGGMANGHPRETLDKIWKDWIAFASYAFNKSHAACYSWVAYQTAYLKAHYPAEFMAANLTCGKDNIADVTKFMDECKAMGVPVLGPNVNESELDFTVNEHGEIRFGLGGIKGVGSNAVDSIIAERNKNGKFKDIFDFIERINMSVCNRKTLESLVLSGAFDCFTGTYREQLMSFNSKGEQVLETIIRYGNKYQSDKEFNQNSLFGGFDAVEIQKPELPEAPKWSTLEKLNKEKELIGIYLSDHPLNEYEFELKEICNITTVELEQLEAERRAIDEAVNAKKAGQAGQASQTSQTQTPQATTTKDEQEGDTQKVSLVQKFRGATMRFGGIVTNTEQRTSKNGNQYAMVTIEDYAGSYTLPLFGDSFTNFINLMQPNMYVYVTAKLQEKGEGQSWFRPKPEGEKRWDFVISNVSQLPNLKGKLAKSITISMSIDKLTEDLIDDLQNNAAEKEDGNVELRFELHNELNKNQIIMVRPRLIMVTPKFYNMLQNYKRDEVFNYFVELS